MNNKLRFILPRLAGAVLIAGVASVIIFTLFKLLVLALVVALVVAAIKGVAGRRHGHYGYFDNREAAAYKVGPAQDYGSYGPQPAYNQQRPAIIPIN